MIKYKNIASHPLTFYGVTFNPNEVKEVPGYVNHIKMIRVKETQLSKPKVSVTIPKEPEVEKKAEVIPTTKRHKKNKN